MADMMDVMRVELTVVRMDATMADYLAALSGASWAALMVVTMGDCLAAYLDIA